MNSYQGNDRPTIRFSEQTWFILQDDHERFSNGTPLPFSAFLNKIFLNFYKTATCSFSIHYENLSISFDGVKQKLIYDKKSKPFEEEKFTEFKSTYLNAYKDELYKKVPVYAPSQDDHSEKIRLNNDVLSVLGELQEKEKLDKFYLFAHLKKLKYPLTSSEEKKFLEDTFIKMYLRAIFEEYASRSSYLREQIYAQEVLDDINKALNDNQKLKIVLAPSHNPIKNIIESKVYHVSPYKLSQDPANLYTYLAGYAQQLEDGDTKAGRPASFRLSKIIKSDVLAQPSALVGRKKEEVKEAIRDNGVQYLTGDAIDVTVRFTKKGLSNLKNYIYMRPTHKELEPGTDNTYTFTCTRAQAINYFFKFGKHAYIVNPIELREEFKKRYLDDYNSYVENEKLEKKQEKE